MAVAHAKQFTGTSQRNATPCMLVCGTKARVGASPQ
eukprot:CAMPEP_0176136640 /NCGR_PEP_ID=MMETSP0120_2-20121206/69347_1 /TAXON_ID=160619 /ORGANISM="Kryptoperidinium foliaceum, Strain CCMP 1326" /LENGTH=35 /DNA_ID= /DNA_START= /DNA_END= /DNA_ORIENTATION=